jgi:signal recognition particle subunit SRP72
MANPTATLTNLLKNTSIDDHEEILRATNAVLKSKKGDQDALHTRTVALLKLDRFEDALRALDEGGDALAERCKLEKGYALYKLGRLEEAGQIVSAGKDSRGLKHLEAQIAYRDERFGDAVDLYQGLRGVGLEGEELDLRINGAAARAQLQWTGRVEATDVTREDMEAFETAYNAACGCIARGELDKAAVLLRRARDLCEGLEDLSDEEKRGEIGPILVQLGYVLTRLGRREEAESLAESVDLARFVIVSLDLRSC